MPLLPDGTPDIAALSLPLAGLIYANGTNKITSGLMMGQEFGADYVYHAPNTPFDLTLTVEKLSEHLACIRGATRWK
ncbi:MAG: hypothetical protein L0G27_05155 [Paracoccus sp. (in: a-proteobacteria)]|nr:hypothetical protein [Paracoccus sp. (in: a-proteobacteria)]